MKQRSKDFPLVLLLPIFCILMLGNSCTKTVIVSVVEDSNFIRIYSDSGNQFCYSLIPSNDGSCLLFASDNLFQLNDASAISILKIDEKGKLLWKKKIPNLNFQYQNVTALKDGGAIISSYTNSSVCRVDKNGAVVFVSSFPMLNENSGTLQTLNGEYHLISSTGGGPSNYSYIHSFKSNGDYKGSFHLPHFKFVPDIKILNLSILKCDTFGSFYFTGMCWPHWNNIFRNQRAKIIVSKQAYDGTNLIQNKVLVLDSLDKDWFVNDYQRILTKSNNFVIVSTQVNFNGVYKGKLTMIDPELNIVWDKNIQIDDATSIYTVQECADGTFVISGEVGDGLKLGWQSFIAKFDINGKMLWKQIYGTPLSSVIGMTVELSDGSLLLGGKTSGIGEGISGDDLTLMKTDKDGNLK